MPALIRGSWVQPGPVRTTVSGWTGYVLTNGFDQSTTALPVPGSAFMGARGGASTGQIYFSHSSALFYPIPEFSALPDIGADLNSNHASYATHNLAASIGSGHINAQYALTAGVLWAPQRTRRLNYLPVVPAGWPARAVDVELETELGVDVDGVAHMRALVSTGWASFAGGASVAASTATMYVSPAGAVTYNDSSGIIYLNGTPQVTEGTVRGWDPLITNTRSGGSTQDGDLTNNPPEVDVDVQLGEDPVAFSVVDDLAESNGYPAWLTGAGPLLGGFVGTIAAAGYFVSAQIDYLPPRYRFLYRGAPPLRQVQTRGWHSSAPAGKSGARQHSTRQTGYY